MTKQQQQAHYANVYYLLCLTAVELRKVKAKKKEKDNETKTRR